MIKIWLKLTQDTEKELYYQSEKIIEITVDYDKYNFKTIAILIRHEDNVRRIYKKFENVIDYSIEEI